MKRDQDVRVTLNKEDHGGRDVRLKKTRPLARLPSAGNFNSLERDPSVYIAAKDRRGWRNDRERERERTTREYHRDSRRKDNKGITNSNVAKISRGALCAMKTPEKCDAK